MSTIENLANPAEKNKPEQTFPALTGVRAIAAYMVFFHHYIGTCRTGMFPSFIKEFYTGVTIFFVLSGFLIYYRYSRSVSLDGDFLFGYFKNRFARIYPAYFFIVIFTALVSFYGPNGGGALYQIALIILQLTFVRGFFNDYKFIGVGQGWTLTVEESFYALFPFFIVSIKKWGFVITLLGAYLAAMILVGIGAIIQFRGFLFPLEFVTNYTFFGRVTEFFCGMYLGKILLAKGVQKSSSRFPAITLLGMAGIIGVIFLMSRFQEPCTYGVFYTGGVIINNLILPVFICLLFYGLIIEESMLQKILGGKIMVLLGKASYAFYLIHVGVFQFVLENTISSNMFVIFIIMNILAVLIYLIIEEPMRKFIRRAPLQS